MNCVHFERWLDEGDVANATPPALAHAAECPRCGRALARARALESALASHFSPDPVAPAADFSSRVLDRIDAIEAKRVRVPLASDALPWWVRVMAEPGVVLSATLVALLLWQGDAMVAFSRAALSRIGQGSGASVPGADALATGVAPLLTALKPVPGADWTVAIAVCVGLAPVMGLMAYGLWRMSERWAGGAPAAAPRRG